MGSTKRQTQQKRAREQTVRERREQKQAKRRAAAAAAERKAQAGENAHLPHSRSAALDVPAMNLAVGDEVVYGPYGVGRITAREKRAGEGWVERPRTAGAGEGADSDAARDEGAGATAPSSR